MRLDLHPRISATHIDMNYNVMMVSLGCSKNRVDAEEMLGVLKSRGHSVVSDPNNADIVIINTCGFIESAKQESIDETLSYARLKEEGKLKYIIMTGCLAQRYAKELEEELPEVDAFVGVTAFDAIADVVDALGADNKQYMRDINDPCFLGLPRVTEDSSVYAYLKIAEGCDNRCSYCAIPYIRGNFRSKPLSSLIDEAKELASRGKKEIIVIAQDITRYGQDLEGNVNLSTLLDELSLIDGIEWIRLMYLNPARVSHEFIDKVAYNKKVLPYFDIPVQHINTELLHSMNREAGSEKIYDVFGYIKEKMPNACLRTTFITGFPGETDEQHREVLEFIKKNPIDNLGVFTFSEEEGTPAVEMENKVPAEVAQKRADRIMTLQKRLLASRLRARRGEEIDVIIEGKKKGSGYYGRSFRDAPDIDGTVYVNTDKKLNVADIVKVKITHTYDYDSEGELL